MIRSFIVNLIDRLSALEITKPIVFCPISGGGCEILNIITNVLKRNKSAVLIQQASVILADVTDSDVKFRCSDNLANDVKGHCVIILDLIVNTGVALKAVVAEINKYHPDTVITYIPFVRNNAILVPSVFESVIGEGDRIVLEGASKASTFLTSKSNVGITLKRLTSDDLQINKCRCGVKSIDKISWADRFYDMVNSTDDRVTYLLIEKDSVVGYLTCHLHRSDCMMLDEIAVSLRSSGQGYGGVLMKWLNIFARSKDCVSIVLWSIENQIPFYEKAGYKLIPGEKMNLDGETYFLMLARLVPEPQGFMVGWMP